MEEISRLPWGALKSKGKQGLPQSIHPWGEENKRQVVLIGADRQCPKPESGGRKVEASMAPGLQLRGSVWGPGMLTSGLHLSSAGPNSAPLAVPPHPILCSQLCP